MQDMLNDVLYNPMGIYKQVFHFSTSLIYTGKLGHIRMLYRINFAICDQCLHPYNGAVCEFPQKEHPNFFLQDYEQFITIICKSITIETWKTFFWQSSEEKFFPYLMSVHFNCSRNMVPPGCCHWQHIIIWQLQDLSGRKWSRNFGVGEQPSF